MAPFNQTELLIEIRGDLQLLAKMAKLFIETADEALDEIESSFDDQKKACRAIHQFKGSLGAIHAGLSFDIATQIESAVAAGNLVAARQIYPTLKEEVARLVEALRPLAVWSPQAPRG